MWDDQLTNNTAIAQLAIFTRCICDPCTFCRAYKFRLFFIYNLYVLNTTACIATLVSQGPFYNTNTSLEAINCSAGQWTCYTLIWICNQIAYSAWICITIIAEVRGYEFKSRLTHTRIGWCHNIRLTDNIRRLIVFHRHPETAFRYLTTRTIAQGIRHRTLALQEYIPAYITTISSYTTIRVLYTPLQVCSTVLYDYTRSQTTRLTRPLTYSCIRADCHILRTSNNRILYINHFDGKGTFCGIASAIRSDIRYRVVPYIQYISSCWSGCLRYTHLAIILRYRYAPVHSPLTITKVIPYCNRIGRAVYKYRGFIIFYNNCDRTGRCIATFIRYCPYYRCTSHWEDRIGQTTRRIIIITYTFYRTVIAYYRIKFSTLNRVITSARIGIVSSS